MVRAHETVVIDAPCAGVFAVLTDLDRMRQWRANVESARWTSQPGAGPHRLHAVTRLLGQRFTWDCDVTAYEPPLVFGYTARNAERGFEVSVEFRCEPVDRGCRVVMTGSGEVPGGRIGAVAAPLYVRALQRENRSSLRKLERLVRAELGAREG